MVHWSPAKIVSVVLVGLVVAAAPALGGAAQRTPLSFARATSYGAQDLTVEIRDLNGDDRADLVTGGLGSVAVLLNRGEGRFRAARYYDVPLATLGDLNRDGKPDLVTVVGDSVSVLLNNGTGAFGAKHDYATGGAPWDVAIGDLSGDGSADLGTTHHESNTASVLLNDGGGTFPTHVELATGSRPTSITLGDLNGDGRSDIVTANANSVSVLLNRGDGSFQAKVDYPTGTSPVPGDR